MKKFLLTATMLITAGMTVQANDYAYLIFETTDGAKVSIPVEESLTLAIDGTTLTAGSQMFTLSKLSKMYFSVSDEQATSLYTFIINTIMNPSSDEDDIKKADINGDGKVNVVDIVTLTNAMSAPSAIRRPRSTGRKYSSYGAGSRFISCCFSSIISCWHRSWCISGSVPSISPSWPSSSRHLWFTSTTAAPSSRDLWVTSRR